MTFNVFNLVLNMADDPQWWQVALIVLDYTFKFVALGWVPADRRPTSAMAWLLAIFLIPFLGLFLFFLMGSPYVNRRRHRIQNEANEAIRTISADEPDIPDGNDVNDEFRSMVQLNRELTAMPAVDGTLTQLYTHYTDSIEAMVRAIDKAREYVNVEIYIMAWDDTTEPFFLALGRAAHRGVKVRVLWDHLGAHKYEGNKDLGKKLTSMGIEWAVMLPLQPWRWRFRRPDLRNHRKLVVVDGDVAFMGSQNMIEAPYENKKNHEIGRHWVDIIAEVRGPVVATINSVFAVDWYTETDESLDLIAPGTMKENLRDSNSDTGKDLMQIVPSGPGFTTEPNLRLFTSMAHHAKRKLQIVSPYFIPDESLMEGVTTACYRGVEVELYVSEESDQALVGHAQSSYYRALLKAGVKIYLYPAPAVLHTKCAVADDDIAVMGSSNMDMRSFGLNYEISMMTGKGELMNQLVALAEEYKEKSTLLTAEEWEKRPWHKKYLDNVARLTSALQ